MATQAKQPKADAANRELLDGLNEDLRGEFQAVIMYRLYASMVQGPYRQELRTFFANEIPEELMHAQILADKISAMGGTPAAEAAPVRVVPEAKAMLETALQAEIEPSTATCDGGVRPRPPASTDWRRSSTTSSRTRPTTATSFARCSPDGPIKQLRAVGVSGRRSAAPVPGKMHRCRGAALWRRRPAHCRVRQNGAPPSASGTTPGVHRKRRSRTLHPSPTRAGGHPVLAGRARRGRNCDPSWAPPIRAPQPRAPGVAPV